jgi:erythromycin esterase
MRIACWQTAVAVALGLIVAGVPNVNARATNPSAATVASWVAHHATPLATTDPRAALDDLAPLGRSVGEAEITGLGESARGAAEELELKLRVLRFLVEERGFRSVAWEEDWATGQRIDQYISGGAGDADALVGQMLAQWHSPKVADVLRWIRAYNTGRSDKVRFVGVEYYLTGQPAYDAVAASVGARAPGQLAELRALLDPLRPATADVFAHIQWYMNQPDKRPYIQAAREVVQLLQGLPHRPGDPAHLLIVQQARQIAYFYEHFSLSAADALVFRDARAAGDLRWWRGFSGDKIVYWAASPHTANAPDLRIADPPAPDMRFPSAGSYLRRWYGRQYLSIGFTFDHGELRLGPGQTVAAPPPRPRWFERPLGSAGFDQFVIDLRQRAPAPVRRWLDAPIVTRGLPDGGPGAHMAGGTLAQWFDLIVHRQTVTPA